MDLGNTFNARRSVPRYADVARVDDEIRRLRLFGVYDFFRGQIIFSSQDYSRCKKFVRDYCDKVSGAIEQYYIVRFDSFEVNFMR